MSEALDANQKSVVLVPEDAEAHYNLGNTLREMARLDEAETTYKQVIALKPDFARAHYNLGLTINELGRLEEAETTYRQAILFEPNYAEVYSALGNTLQELGRLEEAETTYRQAIALKPDYAEVHNNLGVTLQKLGKLKESEVSFRQAIAFKPDYAEVHNNLGVTLQKLGRLKEAEVSFKQAIAFKPDFAEFHSNLCIIFAINEDYDSSVVSAEKEKNIEPRSKAFMMLLSVLKSRQSHKKNGIVFSGLGESVFNMRLTSNPLILQRPVEPELVANLYDIDTIELDKQNDPRFGNGKATDWVLFENYRFKMENVKEDLINIIKKAVKSDIFIYDSFFNILGAGSGSAPHDHLNSLDKTNGLNLYKQKYVLQYYLRVGDQNCDEPGIYKVYGPGEEILPSEGMVIIIPAERMHSAVYGGETDRVMIGINFYALLGYA